MAKEGGLGDQLYVAEFDLSGDIGQLSKIAGGPAALDLTPINASAHERVGGVRDGSIEFMSFFNDAGGAAHPALSPRPSGDRQVSYFHGTTLGNAAASCIAKQINYDPNRDKDGGLTIAVQILATNFGLQWGRQHTAGKRTDGGATNGTSVDGLASNAFGLQAFLHVFAFTGTSATIKLQESSDNAVGDPFADVTGGTFSTVTGPVDQRIATAGGQTIERYLRVVTTGTFSNLVFAVNVIRNLTAVAF
jgi:hypothetical protein